MELGSIHLTGEHLMKNHQLRKMIYQKSLCLDTAFTKINRKTFPLDSLEIAYILAI